MRIFSCLLLLVTAFTLISIGSAQERTTAVPNLIPYGGVLKYAQGGPRAPARLDARGTK